MNEWKEAACAHLCQTILTGKLTGKDLWKWAQPSSHLGYEGPAARRRQYSQAPPGFPAVLPNPNQWAGHIRAELLPLSTLNQTGIIETSLIPLDLAKTTQRMFQHQPSEDGFFTQLSFSGCFPCLFFSPHVKCLSLQVLCISSDERFNYWYFKWCMFTTGTMKGAWNPSWELWAGSGDGGNAWGWGLRAAAPITQAGDPQPTPSSISSESPKVSDDFIFSTILS